MDYNEDIVVSDASGSGAQFFIAVCKEPQRKCTPSTCQSCDVNDPAGTNTWAATGDTCAAIGKFSQPQSFSLQNPSDPQGGVQLSISEGDYGRDTSGQQIRRSATIKIACDDGSSTPRGVKGAEVPKGSLRYEIEIAAAAGCPICLEGCPLSWGWLTIIFSGVIVVVYFVGGVSYNIRVGNKEGMEAIPQWSMWQQLPGLLKDGNRLFWSEGRLLMRDGRKRVREWYDNRGSKELREPIAAVPEGS